jgi:hypothetical protein
LTGHGFKATIFHFRSIEMKLLFLGLSVVLLSGCGMTPEQQNALAAAMNSAGQGLAQEAQIMRQRQHEQSLQPNNMYPLGRQLNCVTEYNSFSRAYETRCQ